MIDLMKKSDNEILEIINPIMDNLMEGSTEINHEKHTQDFTERLKNVVKKSGFDIMCKGYQSRWGIFQERTAVAVFRRENSVAVVWKQECSKTDDEYVAEAVFVKADGKYLVDHTWVY